MYKIPCRRAINSAACKETRALPSGTCLGGKMPRCQAEAALCTSFHRSGDRGRAWPLGLSSRLRMPVVACVWLQPILSSLLSFLHFFLLPVFWETSLAYAGPSQNPTVVPWWLQGFRGLCLHKATWSGADRGGSTYPHSVCLCSLTQLLSYHALLFSSFRGVFQLQEAFMAISKLLISPEHDSSGGAECSAMRSKCPQSQSALERAGCRWLGNPNLSGSRAPSLGLLALVFPTCSHILKP